MAFKGVPVDEAVAAGKLHPWEDGEEGQNMSLPPNMPLWRTDYFELKILTKELVQGPRPLCSPESRRLISHMTEAFPIRRGPKTLSPQETGNLGLRRLCRQTLLN